MLTHHQPLVLQATDQERKLGPVARGAGTNDAGQHISGRPRIHRRTTAPAVRATGARRHQADRHQNAPNCRTPRHAGGSVWAAGV